MPFWGEYVSVEERRKAAQREVERLRKTGKIILPVAIQGKTIAASFWGKSWCAHLEKFSDFANRLPRGRTYARNGSVVHLEIKPGLIEALVSGSRIYQVKIKVAPLKKHEWEAIRERCAGGVGSMLDLLRGRLSDGVMSVVCDPMRGLFPKPGEMELACGCPDWVNMCKHLAAVMYGVAARLDSEPEALFRLRGVDPAELIREAALNIPAAPEADGLAGGDLAALFGIEFEPAPAIPVAPKVPVPVAPAIHRGRAPKKPTRSAPAKPARAAAIVKSPVAAQAPAARRKAKAPKTTSAGPKRHRRAFILGDPPTGAQIRELRLAAGIPVGEFAQALGVSPAAAYQWEKRGGALSLQPKSLAGLLLFEKNLLDPE